MALPIRFRPKLREYLRRGLGIGFSLPTVFGGLVAVALGVLTGFYESVLTDGDAPWSPLAAVYAILTIGALRLGYSLWVAPAIVEREWGEKSGERYREAIRKVREERDSIKTERDQLAHELAKVDRNRSPDALLGFVVTDQAAWREELGRLRDLAARLFRTLAIRFEKHGFWNMGASRSALTTVVSGAPWPGATLDIDADPVAVVDSGALAEFANRVYRRAGVDVFGESDDYFDFDDLRREASGIVETWGERLSDNGGFCRWLVSEAGPTQHDTLKLLWYLELALARDIGREDEADFTNFERVRDCLTSEDAVTPSPSTKTTGRT